MRELRWVLQVGPLIGVLALVAVIGSGSGPGAGVAARAECPGTPSGNREAHGAGFTVEPVLDGDGALSGQRVRVGTAARTTASVDLPPESFAAGPFKNLVLVGSDDGTASTLRAFDAVSGCSSVVATEADVIRRATVDPSTSYVYEFRVDRDTRADLGVWRQSIGGGAATRVMAPLAADDRYGVTFSTELTWSAEGDVLVVQSCGVTACRTRLLDTATGDVQSIDGPDQGDVIGLAAGHLVTYAACRGLPCPIKSVDTVTGATSTLARAAGFARLVDTTGGPRLLHESGSDGARQLLLVNVASGEAARVAAADQTQHLVPAAGRAGGGTSLPPGFAIVSIDGRATAPGDPAQVIRLNDGATLSLIEVTR